MFLHSWTLELFLCFLLLGNFLAQPTSETGNRAGPPDGRDNFALPFLSWHFSLSSDLWGGGAQAGEASGSTESATPKTGHEATEMSPLEADPLQREFRHSTNTSPYVYSAKEAAEHGDKKTTLLAVHSTHMKLFPQTPTPDTRPARNTDSLPSHVVKIATATTAAHLGTFAESTGLDTTARKPTFPVKQDIEKATATATTFSPRTYTGGVSSPKRQTETSPTMESNAVLRDGEEQPVSANPTGSSRKAKEGKVAESTSGVDEGRIIRWTSKPSPVVTLEPGMAESPTTMAWLLHGTTNKARPTSFFPDYSTNASNAVLPTWTAGRPTDPEEDTAFNQSSTQPPLLAPPMFVPLHSDWNTAMATWGLAWEAHVYGLGSLFAVAALASLLNLLFLPLRRPSGCGYFALVDAFLLAAGISRAFSLFYDAYSHQDKLPATGTLLLYEAPFPCLTAAFGIVFLLLSLRSRMQLSHAVLQHPGFLGSLVLLHFAAAFGSVALLRVFAGLPCLFFVAQGAFVILAATLSTGFFAFYCYVRADAKHIYHLNNTSPAVERRNRCPFADARDWDRAAAAAMLAALLVLACAGLQLYAMLHALGLGGSGVFPPWPWWAFHFSCRITEAGACLALVYVVAQPLLHVGEPQPTGCWPKFFQGNLSLKAPALWSLSQQDKLATCEGVGANRRGESECLPLYALGSSDGLDLLCHSNRALTTKEAEAGKPNSQRSSSDSDWTADLRPPSPIDLRRSIDEALFSDSLFTQSLFGSSRDLSWPTSDLNDHALCRTASCGEMETPPPSLVGHRGSGLERDSISWQRGSCNSLYGSSLVLCSSPERSDRTSLTRPHCTQVPQFQRPQRTSNMEEPVSDEQDVVVQAEFISVCRQIDALSVCSDTIDL